MNICMFCSANELDDRYTVPAKELAGLIASSGHTLVWGGSNVGLMKDIADAAQAAGGKIIGISMKKFAVNARPNADEMVITDTLSQRKNLLLERSDVIVMLVGGFGTLDEMTEILELKKHGDHDKPIIVLNSDGFYDGLQIQLQRMEEEGFLPKDSPNVGIKARNLDEFINFARTPQEVMDTINKG